MLSVLQSLYISLTCDVACGGDVYMCTCVLPNVQIHIILIAWLTIPIIIQNVMKSTKVQTLGALQFKASSAGPYPP